MTLCGCCFQRSTKFPSAPSTLEYPQCAQCRKKDPTRIRVELALVKKLTQQKNIHPFSTHDKVVRLCYDEARINKLKGLETQALITPVELRELQLYRLDLEWATLSLTRKIKLNKADEAKFKLLKRRADVVWIGKDPDDGECFFLVLEADEQYHMYANVDCEISRLLDVKDQFGGHRFVCIRYACGNDAGNLPNFDLLVNTINGYMQNAASIAKSSPMGIHLHYIGYSDTRIDKLACEGITQSIN